jgi:hypothetical protein
MTPWTGQAARLADRIAAFVDGSLAGRATEPFEQLALAVHRWQAAHDPVVAALIDRPIASWRDIPAVPVSLFKDLPVGTVGRAEPAAVFRTSGTTGGGRGEHRVRSTALYDRGALGWARACVPAMPDDVVALLDDPARTPDSSLAHMVALFGVRRSWHVCDGNLDADGASAAVRVDRPVFVATTAFALAEWLDHDVPALPAGSVLMVTGGFKGRAHRLDGPALYAETTRRLRPTRIATEYGMTELSSQLWGTPTAAFRPPPWLRPYAVDPATGTPLPPGERGQLRFVDLCNLDGTLAIETMDQGTVGDDGAVELDGRLPGSPLRGCSLTVEEAWLKREEA